MNERADGRIEELVAWALPIQQRHYDSVVNASLGLAGDEHPDEAA